MIKRMVSAALLCSTGLSTYAFAEEAIDPEQLFKEAMQLRDAGEIYNAIEVFETVISKQPGLHRARLELAVAYHSARRFEEAREQLTQVLNNPETPETVKLSITAYLAQLSSDQKASEKRTSASVYTSLGLFTDSNINLAPAAEIATPGTTENSSYGFAATASYSHSSRSPKPFSIGDKPVDFEWHSQATAYAKVYVGDEDGINGGSFDENDFNVHVLSLSTGPALVSKNNWQGAFNIHLDKVFFGNDPYSFNIGLNPVFTMNFANELDISVENLTTVREFSTETELDGVSKMYGISASKFYKQQTVGVEAGIRYHSNGADANFLNANGIEVFVSGQMPIWENARTYLQLSTRDYDYKSPDPTSSLPTTAREDTEQQAVIGISHDFVSGPLKSWTLNTQLTYTDNESNVSELEYDRTVVEFNLRSYF